jgi:HD-GYP domain-containing protein (c-di-GMP phosphodiesterase class II)
VVDAFDAMTADRPYRAALPVEAAVEELEKMAGTQFDPEVVRVVAPLSEQLIPRTAA